MVLLIEQVWFLTTPKSFISDLWQLLVIVVLELAQLDVTAVAVTRSLLVFLI